MSSNVSSRISCLIAFIKSNVLVDESGTAQLADFGISQVSYATVTDRTKTTTTQSCGTYNYSSPEFLRNSHSSMFTIASDSWAFGMLMWEAFTGLIPYGELGNTAAVIAAIVNESKLPAFPLCPRSRNRGFDIEIWQIMERCWSYETNERPTSQRLEAELRIAAQHTVIQPIPRTDEVSAFNS